MHQIETIIELGYPKVT